MTKIELVKRSLNKVKDLITLTIEELEDGRDSNMNEQRLERLQELEARTFRRLMVEMTKASN